MPLPTATSSAVRDLQARVNATLFRTLAESRVVSAPGILGVLLMVEAGARGTTAEELAALTGVTPDAAAPAYAKLDATLASGGVIHAGAIWSQFLLHSAYTSALPSVRVAHGLTQETLDRWTAEKTLGMIDRFPVAITEETVMAVATTLALRMRWERGTFDPHDTTDGVFTTPGLFNTTQQVSAQFMTTGRAREYTIREGVATADLGTMEGVTLRVGLGAAGADAAQVMAAMQADGQRQDTDLTLQMPRFSVASRISLAEPLHGWGVREVFTPHADLSGMHADLYAQEAVQHCLVRVDETGIEAAAVTATAFAASAMRLQREHVVLRLDRPFAFLVLKDGLPLFSGWVARP